MFVSNTKIDVSGRVGKLASTGVLSKTKHLILASCLGVLMTQTQFAVAGSLPLDAGSFSLVLDSETGTMTKLSSKSNLDFSYTPQVDAQDGIYSLGDIDLRLRRKGGQAWEDFSSAYQRKPISDKRAKGNTLLSADITKSFGADFPLTVTRSWIRKGEELVMRFTLHNPTSQTIEVGGAGLPMIFNNNLSGKTLEEAHTENVFFDPYIGEDAGYLQVARLDGQQSTLLVLPEKGTPFEEYKPIQAAEWTQEGEESRCKPVPMKDCTRTGITFEGKYSWVPFAGGYAQDWPTGASWNETNILELAPGESYDMGVRFVLAPSVRDINDTLIKADHPVAVSLPGYVLPKSTSADLYLKAPSKVKKVSVFPAGALTIKKEKSRKGWSAYKVTGETWGRSRVTVAYADGREQTIHYYVIKDTASVLDDFGNFLFNEQWYENPDDLFNRSPSIMSYDREENKIVLQHNQVWIAGLSDEGGAGSWLSAISKQLLDPDPEEIAKFERFYTEVVDGRLQLNEGPNKYGVVKSLFWYDPKLDAQVHYDKNSSWDVWSAWDEPHAKSVVRSFNYPHVAVAQWVLYRLARNYDGLVKAHDAIWYLNQAYHTAQAMVRLAPHYSTFGQMGGDYYIELLKDLRREGLVEKADALETTMRARANHWLTLSYPFGSEMPWDSTGQAEIHAWLRYFGHTEQADMTREVVVAYDPAIPHWGYNGSARRYWDFIFAGKTKRIERQLHHYGSGWNAVPLFTDYRRNPDDFHLLKVAYGGLLGTLTNIDQDGFGSAAFHSMPDMRKHDGYSGDYGPGFAAHALSTASYLVNHETFGWTGFGGNVEKKSGKIIIKPNDSGKMRSFIEPIGAWLTLDSGKFKSISYNPKTQQIDIELYAEGSFSTKARLRIEAIGENALAYVPTNSFDRDAGSWAIPFTKGKASVTLKPASN